MWPFSRKSTRWLGNTRSGTVHVVGHMKNQCNVDDMSPENWLPLNDVHSLNAFMDSIWQTGQKAHFCEHCTR